MATIGRTGSPVLCGAVAVTVSLVTLACADVTEPSRTPVPTNPTGGAFADTPRFRVDPFWARQLPNNWILGQVSGVAVDERDHVWIVHRPRTLDARQRGEEGMCCVAAPPVIEFSPDGTVGRSWGGPGEGFEWPESEHGIHVDQHGHVWIGGNGASDAHVLKFTSDGEFLLQIGRAGQSGDTPDAAPIRHFRSPVHDVRISHDGLVYVADRTNNRLQVFQKDGAFVTEAFVRRETLGSGSVSGVTLSTDATQRWLFVPDGTNNVVWILDRMSLTVVDHFGRLGKNAGQFYRLHNLAIDSRGNLYTTEVNVGQRLQKFDRVGE